MNDSTLRGLLALAVMAAFSTDGMIHAAPPPAPLAGPTLLTQAPIQSAARARADAESQYRYSVECHAEDQPITYCDWNHSHGRPQLLRQLGRKPCIRNTTWGYNNRGIWVRNRCEGLFVTE